MSERAAGGLIPPERQGFLLRGECIFPAALVLNDARYRATLDALNADPPEES